MSTRSLIALFAGALVALQVGCGACAPTPVIPSVNQGRDSPKSQAIETPPMIVGEAQINLPQQQQVNANVNANGLLQAIKQQQQQQQSIKTNNADKLKRSLTSFMNQLNPASFFVPASMQPNAQQQQQQVGKGEPVALVKQLSGGKTSPQTTAETAAIVNGYPTVDVLIKGPNRSFQTRPIGGPLRWG